MSGFFSKLFGGKKEDGSNQVIEATDLEGIIQETLEGLIIRAGLDLEFAMNVKQNGDIQDIHIDVSGSDEDLVTEKDGALLDAFQLYVKRVVQHRLPEAKVEVSFDCNGFREDSIKSLVEMADRLREKCLDTGKSQYMRALPPKDRKVVHQHLATDDRVRSRSVGEGLFKKVKIYPAKAAKEENEEREESAEQT